MVLFAVFAPDNSALTQPITDKAALKQFVLNSLVGEALKVSDLKTRPSVKTLGGMDLPVKVVGGELPAPQTVGTTLLVRLSGGSRCCAPGV